jgi:hypothetical protein
MTDRHTCLKCNHEFDVEPMYEEVGDCESGPRVECIGLTEETENCPECGHSVYDNGDSIPDHDDDVRPSQCAIDMGYYYK